MIEDDIKNIKSLANVADENAKNALSMVQLLAEHLNLKLVYNDKYSFKKKVKK